MKKKSFTLLLLFFAGYGLYSNRFRVLNSLLGNPGIRRVAVSYLMGVPWARKKMMSPLFRGPEEWR
ncbi:hypothetical protein [Bacillus massilinigeriensis]|uniref:hypothetical protein n=1 Tax=Bacillus mediterraneensis TaxID=1805474 RepID=UPI0008F89824|nr:hypothetical protein [Bacillus mediterraneensis]